jgi:hypothetical protein
MPDRNRNVFGEAFKFPSPTSITAEEMINRALSFATQQYGLSW